MRSKKVPSTSWYQISMHSHYLPLSYIDFPVGLTMSNLSAVRHLRLDWQWFLTISRPPGPHFNTISQCKAEILII